MVAPLPIRLSSMFPVQHSIEGLPIATDWLKLAETQVRNHLTISAQSPLALVLQT